MNTLLKQPGQPSEGAHREVYLDRKAVMADVFNTMSFEGPEQYAIIRKPNTGPGISISVRKL